MKALVTGSGGLIGSEAAKFFAEKGFEIVGVDNDMRSYFFGKEASTEWNRKKVEDQLRAKYTHYQADFRDDKAIDKIFAQHKFDLIIHTAAQPSHDWAAREPITDFTVNANGTLVMLEAMRNDYVRTAKAKGLQRSRIIWKHGFRNALIPLITILFSRSDALYSL
jgi:CDP-paratose 2-epimerase